MIKKQNNLEENVEYFSLLLLLKQKYELRYASKLNKYTLLQ